MNALNGLNAGWCINAYRAKDPPKTEKKKRNPAAKGSHIVRNSVMWLKCK